MATTGEAAGVKSLESKLSDFASQMLQPVPGALPTEKVVHDAVWGPVFLRGPEVCFLDTSLMQRLRYLHQTGFAFQVFPSAGHSRFEHSLGVLRQTESHLRALSNRFRDHVTPEAVSTLRLAALLHDCSHGMFSHTSEEIYRFMPDMLDLTHEGGRYPNHKASELVALLILQSGRFKEFIDSFAKNSAPVHTDGARLANLITGNDSAVDPHHRWMVDIINGPIDADKLDYIRRDGLHTGIPLTLDLERFWLTTEIAYLPKGCVPSAIENETRLVINRAGINSVEQILFARFQLTSAVYQHHKIRSCDCLFKSWIEQKQSSGKFTTTVDFINGNDLDYLVEIRNLRRDQMLARALVISEGTAKSQLPESLWDLAIKSNKDDSASKDLRQLSRLIAEEANLPPEHAGLVWIDLPAAPKVDDLGATIVNLGNVKDPFYDTLDHVFPVKEWGKTYLQKKWRGHVFAPLAYRSAVNRVAKRLFEDRFPGLAFSDAATSICKL